MKDERSRDLGALLLGVFATILLTPLRGIWADPSRPWWTPFVLWTLLAFSGAWLAWKIGGQRTDDGQ